MITLSRNNKHSGPMQVVDALPHDLAHSAGKTATRFAEAVETGGVKVARTAGQAVETGSEKVVRTAGQASGRAAKLRSRFGHPSIRSRFGPVSADLVLKTQLARTSRELAHESSDIGAAVESLNAIIKKNRKVGAKARTRLIGGFAIGAAVMYHLDPAHGRERRAATARMVAGAGRGQNTLKQP